MASPRLCKSQFLSIAIVIVWTLVASSCQTYFQKTRLVQEYFQKSQFEDAMQVVKHTRFYFKPKNELLYHLEMGTLSFFNSDFKGAIDHFNMADYFVEDHDTRTQKAQDIAKEVLWNSASSVYNGEYFERFMIHYYKILAYLALNNNEDARVEARRMEITLAKLKDITDNKTHKKYTSDAFVNIMEGLIYERIKEYNNAFIAYRNAYELFEASGDGKSNNIEMPMQLRLDLARMSKYAGMNEEYKEYVSKWNLLEKDIFPDSPYEMVLFWENGLVPIKVERNYWFIPTPGTDGVFAMYNNNLDLLVPIPSGTDMQGFTLNDIGILRLALPKLVARKPMITGAKLYLQSVVREREESREYKLAPVSDVVALEKSSMQDRRSRDIPIALSRLIIGKVAELSLRIAAKKETSSPTSATILGLSSLFMGAFNASKEKADTRSWLTLPSKIYYARVPLKQGENHLSMKFIDINGRTQEYKFSKNVEKEGIYIHSVRTPNSLPPDPLHMDNL